METIIDYETILKEWGDGCVHFESGCVLGWSMEVEGGGVYTPWSLHAHCLFFSLSIRSVSEYTNTNTQSKKEFRAIESAEQSEKELSGVDGRGGGVQKKEKKDRRNNWHGRPCSRTR